MAGRIHQIGASVPVVRLLRVGLERQAVEEQQLPAADKAADVERERQLVLRRTPLHRRQSLEIGKQVTQIALSKWSEADIAEMLATGKIPGDRVGGAMVDVVRNTAQLTPDDRAAIAVYIKSLPPVEGYSPPKRQ